MISSAKRGKNEHQGLHKWHPYYAGYSESFVLTVLKAEKIGPNDIVLDPWMGSGTTGLVCQKQNINCLGADINPIMSSFAAAKSNAILSELDINGIDILENIIKKYKYDSRRLVKKIKSTDIAIEHLKKLRISIADFFGDNPPSIEVDPLQSFFYSVLFYTSRKSLAIRSGSNPTWVNNKEFESTSSTIDLISDFKNNYLLMFQQLKNYFENVDATSLYKIYCADCKSLPIEDNTVDIIISSPPYLTRIDYAASTKFELQLLFSPEDYLKIRQKTMGTTTVPKNAVPINQLWGEICSEVLFQVKNHKSVASDTYYLKNKSRYFSDAYNSLMEIFRVLKTGKSAYLVLQNSYYKEIEIPLYDIYCEMATNIGYSTSKVVKEEKVRASIGQINPKSTAYLKDKVYYEKIIKVTK